MEFTAASFSLLSVSLSTILFYIIYSLSFGHVTTSRSNITNNPLIGNMIVFFQNRHRFHDWVTTLLAESPTLTIQINGPLNHRGICTVDPLNIQHILAVNFRTYVKGSRFNDVFREFIGDGIFNADGDLWSGQRKIASHEFNTKSLKHFIEFTVQAQLSDRLVPCLSDVCDNGEVIDLQEVLRKFTFDNVSSVAFGVDPKSMLETRDSDSSVNSCFVRAFDDAVEIIADRIITPLPQIWKMKRFFNFGSEKRFKIALKTIDDYAVEIIKLKEESSNDEHQDLLSRFMTSSSSSKIEFENEEQKRKFLRDIVISFILAGKDTTATALTWFFWLIAGNPVCSRKIHTELSSLQTFSYDDLKRCDYLHAALSESMRLFPPVPINSRLAISDDVLPDGTRVKKGWFVDYSAYAMGRMDRVWGEDCREFKPERWLDDEGKFRPSDQFRYPVFHGGPRICLGKDMGFVQMKSIVAAVMSEFEIVTVDGGGCRERMVDPPYMLSLTLKMIGGLLVRLKRRKS